MGGVLLPDLAAPATMFLVIGYLILINAITIFGGATLFALVPLVSIPFVAVVAGKTAMTVANPVVILVAPRAASPARTAVPVVARTAEGITDPAIRIR